MRILHGYTSIGLVPGLLTCALTFPVALKRGQVFSSILILTLLVMNIVLINVNSWIAIQGMGIPNGNLLHLALAITIAINLVLARQSTLNPQLGGPVTAQAPWDLS